MVRAICRIAHSSTIELSAFGDSDTVTPNPFDEAMHWLRKSLGESGHATQQERPSMRCSSDSSCVSRVRLPSDRDSSARWMKSRLAGAMENGVWSESTPICMASRGNEMPNKTVSPRYVKQLDPVACGLACVASLAGVRYESVRRRAFDIFDWSRCARTKSRHLRTLLRTFGIETLQGRAVRKWASVPDRAIVAINPIGDRWHWVVHHRTDGCAMVMDPNAKRPGRTDFGRMRLRSYVAIV
ncbi:hypothetical protein SAMN05216551_101490 [Chitinasiproducens palmae]|uniref:Peptidase C39 domain-containing protein n=1 Tax=Chitinasiproducens palmae TaxID=1770053 RepID=A0A1H2PKY6_9BURK|nr:hypothetical protein SAMN05216551_101490 [Chitinasiproducens palmae]